MKMVMRKEIECCERHEPAELESVIFGRHTMRFCEENKLNASWRLTIYMRDLTGAPCITHATKWKLDSVHVRLEPRSQADMEHQYQGRGSDRYHQSRSLIVCAARRSERRKADFHKQ
jgi:hypothetical protein